MEVLLICQKCDKPKKSSVPGKALKGKKLYKALKERDDLPFEVGSCKCLGKCKQGPNGLFLPGGKRVHRLSEKAVLAMK
jgi:predicted metal-binding protein